MIRPWVLAGALAVAAGFAGTAQASLIGTVIDVTSGNGFLPSGGCSGVTVGAGVECVIGDVVELDDDVIKVDVQDSSIVFEFEDGERTFGEGFLWNFPEPFEFDVVVSGLTWVDDPLAEIASISTSLQLFGEPGDIGNPNTIGATLSAANQVTLNFGDLDRVNCAPLCARLTVDIFPDKSGQEPQVIPLPAGLPLMLGGLALLGVASRRKSRQ